MSADKPKWQAESERRAVDHRARADEAVPLILGEAARLGITCQLFGSYVHGLLMAHSDVDIMMLDYPDRQAVDALERFAHRLSDETGVEFDLIPGWYLTQEGRDELLKP